MPSLSSTLICTTLYISFGHTPLLRMSCISYIRIISVKLKQNIIRKDRTSEQAGFRSRRPCTKTYRARRIARDRWAWTGRCRHRTRRRLPCKQPSCASTSSCRQIRHILAFFAIEMRPRTAWSRGWANHCRPSTIAADSLTSCSSSSSFRQKTFIKSIQGFKGSYTYITL